jgi:predicted Rossmann fold nucleotide-binding protein DprA/Smf involved in DNA uptake
MKRSAQSSRDRIRWILANSAGKMERSRLRRCAGMRYADLDPILAELEKEGRIIPLTGKEMIILKDR